MMRKLVRHAWLLPLCLLLVISFLVFPTDPPVAADVYGTSGNPGKADNMDQPYTRSPVVVCVRDITGTWQEAEKAALQNTFVSWLNSSSNPTGWGGIPSVSFSGAARPCDSQNVNLYLDFRSGSNMGNRDSAFPEDWIGVPTQYGTVTRWDELNHIVQAGIAINIDTWGGKTETQKQFLLFHEVGHALGVSHEGPVLSPVAFGKAPFTKDTFTCENYNCLASTYDTADYEKWEYNPVTQKWDHWITNSDTAWTDREMIGAYYGSPGVGMRAAQPIYSCLGNPAPGVLRATAIDASRYEDGYLAELYKWTGSQWVYYGPPKWLWPSTSPVFGARMTAADFDIGEDTGQFSVGFRGHREDSGYNYTEPVDWSYIIEVTGYTNNDVHPPCTISPARAAANVSYLNWVRASQNESYVVALLSKIGFPTE